ncbi:hypothetical protein FRB90_007211 [Tulasnella sp. 427]|nr:hypothetical protein FRB90_007211 [Tulasnella sp. 427]
MPNRQELRRTLPSLGYNRARFCKPIVDAIGRLESRDASLADCVLELLRCAREIGNLDTSLDLGDSLDFSFHAIITFNREFQKLNTDYHFLTLYLHPLCRWLAVSKAPRSQSFKTVCLIAGTLAKKLGWNAETTSKLFKDLQDYQNVAPPFTGGVSDGAAWWRALPGVSIEEHPIKAMATVLFAIVPHTAEVERVFSSLGGFHSPRRSRLSVESLEMLGKLRSHYVGLMREKGLNPDRRDHTHSRTPNEPGVDSDLVNRLINEDTVDTEEAERAVQELRALEEVQAEMDEESTAAELDRAWEELELDQAAVDNVTANQLEVPAIYSMEELAKVDAGMVPKSVEEDFSSLVATKGASWDLETLIIKAGIA